MPQNILGIDLGSYSVKIAQVERGFGEFKLVNFFEVPLVAEEVLSYQEAASAALAKFFSENPIPYDSCVISLPGNMVSFRTIELPFVNAKKIDQTIEFELEAAIPFEIEETLYDYTILSTQGQTSKVLATYIPEEAFKGFLNQIQKSDVDPRYVGVDTLDLSYLTMLGALPPEGRYALLDIGHSKTNLILLEGSRVKAVRCFSWGGHGVTQAIAKAANLSYEEAETFKHSKGHLLEKTNDPALQAIHGEFEDLAKELKKTLFSFYEFGESAIEALYLFGGTSKTPGIDSFFSQRLNINVSYLDVLDESYTELLDRESIRHTASPAFAMALHAAFLNKGAKINFRWGPYAYKKDIEQLEGSLKKIGILAASVVGIGIVYFIISYMTLSSQVDKMNRNVATIVRSSVSGLPKKGIKSSKSAISILNGKILAIDEKLKKVQGNSSESALSVLKMISASLPPRDQLVVNIDDVNITPQRVRMEGRTVSYEGVDKVKSSLEKIKVFKNVQTGNVRKGIRNQIKFSLSFDVVEGEG